MNPIRSLPARSSWRRAVAARAGALAGALAAAPALAQTPQSVQLYGLLDSGIEYLSRVAGQGAQTRLPVTTGGQAPSRVGLRGTEDLGNGLRVVFVMEAGMAVANGSSMQGGRLFGRQAYLGLAGAWGQLTLGRQYTMGHYALMGSDLMGPAVFGLASLDAYIPNARLNDAIAYRLTAGPWTAGAVYSRGRDGQAPSFCGSADSANGCAAYSGMLRYDNTRWSLTVAHDRLKGIGGSGVFGQPRGLSLDDHSQDDRSYLAGHVQLGDLRLGAGAVLRRLKAASQTYRGDLYFLAASYPVARATVVDATYSYLDTNRRGEHAQLLVLRVTQTLSPRTAVYALTGQVRNGAAADYSVSNGTVVPASPGLGKSQTGFMVGMRHSF